MTGFTHKLLLIVFFVALGSSTAWAADTVVVPERILGKVDAPITVEEFVSLTCSHCADFYTNVLPELEKKYVESGKVRFILRDFPLDGTALKAAALARCLPADTYYPFVKTLYASQKDWLMSSEPEKTLIQYARLAGLSEEKAQACIKDEKMMDALIAERTHATEKMNIEATPTFVINSGAEVIKGSQPAATFAAIFDRLLAAKK